MTVLVGTLAPKPQSSKNPTSVICDHGIKLETLLQQESNTARQKKSQKERKSVINRVGPKKKRKEQEVSGHTGFRNT